MTRYEGELAVLQEVAAAEAALEKARADGLREKDPDAYNAIGDALHQVRKFYRLHREGVQVPVGHAKASAKAPKAGG
jgi:hypothetical protein